METEPAGKTGASSSDAAKAPPVPTVELKDGKVLVDGKSYVAESDLIAAKKSLESKLEQAQTAHNGAIDTARLSLSEAQQQVAALNAKLKENEQARKSGAVSSDEAARVKQELDAAKSSVETLQKDAARALEYRRALMVVQYGVNADTIKDKDMKALDSFEEALKAVASQVRGSGVGNYAFGGGAGVAVPVSNMDRAARVLAATPVRGVRNAEPGK